MGFGWGGLFDPTVGDSSEVIVLIQRLTLLLLFFAVDGHLRLMEIWCEVLNGSRWERVISRTFFCHLVRLVWRLVRDRV
jgi:flagellar biosynthesis protein FliR